MIDILTALNSKKKNVSSVVILENLFERKEWKSSVSVKGDDGNEYELLLTTPVISVVQKHVDKFGLDTTYGLELYVRNIKTSVGIYYPSWAVAQDT